ncbi:hypothetical protein BDQ12DRAFT_761294 [Crucibulum laeve]|uniref:Zn(2)-C6 fungal-type domain-containing protein n=1 Tax=Crucibulum laeve TaxID=68775 RepID=A0A5C3M192_9AGAR|nr:hypothetical protein BDQ12DRAFT_761294 [Crucibulum laeve]
MPSESFQPLQLKGEIMDLEFTIDTDHRKRRRNRTTQSCLNCHTSKRKCDRKRPCQRCIQLGLTGLCVYEIDDPALRDDPSVDENTRLRNRIAELESLVRELRGKPHPRWAESNFRDGDPNEKWHSRATKCAPLPKRNGQGPDEHLARNGRAVPALLSPIKTEPASEANAHLYRFSPSPAPSMRYHTFQADVRNPPSSTFENEQRQNYSGPGSSPVAYHGSSNPHYQGGHGNGSAASTYSDGGGSGGNYPLSGSEDGHSYSDQFSPGGTSSQSFCPCRTSPGTGVAYISLSQQLQNSLNSLRQYSHHPPNTPCLLYRRIVELNNLMHGTDITDGPGPAYDSNTPSDNELLTPLSASSGHTSFHNGSPAVSPQEWNNLAAAGYNPYFPIQPGEHHGVYSHVMS